jgi:hypothetical protein
MFTPEHISDSNPIESMTLSSRISLLVTNDISWKNFFDYIIRETPKKLTTPLEKFAHIYETLICEELVSRIYGTETYYDDIDDNKVYNNKMNLELFEAYSHTLESISFEYCNELLKANSRESLRQAEIISSELVDDFQITGIKGKYVIFAAILCYISKKCMSSETLSDITDAPIRDYAEAVNSLILNNKSYSEMDPNIIESVSFAF